MAMPYRAFSFPAACRPDQASGRKAAQNDGKVRVRYCAFDTIQPGLPASGNNTTFQRPTPQATVHIGGNELAADHASSDPADTLLAKA
jgi:hypothetical protein